MNCWAKNLGDFLEYHGFRNEWETENASRDFLENLKCEIKAQAKAEAVAEVNSLPSLALYAQKGSWCNDNQKIMSLPENDRRIMLAMRLNLPTLVDFYMDKKARCKRCKLCKTNTDQIWEHLLSECGIVESERQRCGLNNLIMEKRRENPNVQVRKILYDDQHMPQLLEFGKK